MHAASPGDGRVYLGPFGSTARARLAKEALEETAPIRRCTTSMGATTRFAPCALADMGRCLAPCDGRTDAERYGGLVRWLASSLASSPGELLEALERRMTRLAEAERYEEASSVRDRLRALAEGLWRSRVDTWLVDAGRLELRAGDGETLRFDHGALLTPVPPASRSPRPARVSGPTSWPPCDRGWRSIVHSSPPCDRAPPKPVEGGAALARVLRRTREASGNREDRRRDRRR